MHDPGGPGIKEPADSSEATAGGHGRTAGFVVVRLQALGLAAMSCHGGYEDDEDCRGALGVRDFGEVRLGSRPDP